MNSRLLLAAMAALALAGCASVGSNKPATAQALAPAAGAWQAPVPPALPSAALRDWWQRFDDPLLMTLIDAAQAGSPTLASAGARIEQARAALVASGAVLLPQVDAAIGVSRSRADLAASAATTASAGAQATWELDLFGAARAARDAGAARLAASESALAAARVALAAEVGTLYTALRACEAQIHQAEADTASRSETARVTDEGARAGFIAPATAALARASAAQARSLLAVQRAQCDTQVKALVALTALEEPTLRARLGAGRAMIPTAAAIAPPAVPGELLGRRPDLQEAARQVEAAAADERTAQARRLPRVSLSGSVTALRLDSGPVTLDGTTWAIGPLQVSLPLFDGGTRAAQAAAAQAVYDEAVAGYRGRLRLAVREVEEALVALQSTADREGDAGIAAKDFELSFRATEARFKGGLASVFELEDARRTTVAAQSALLDLQRERTTAWIALYRSLGGGLEPADPAAPQAAARRPATPGLP